MSDYTVEMDVRTVERRRQQGDVGVIAQRYVLVLFGNSQSVELQPWQPVVKMTASAPFPWKADTWYRVKLEVQNLPDGKTRARAKAWPRGRRRTGRLAGREGRSHRPPQRQPRALC